MKFKERQANCECENSEECVAIVILLEFWTIPMSMKFPTKRKRDKIELKNQYHQSRHSIDPRGGTSFYIHAYMLICLLCRLLYCMLSIFTLTSDTGGRKKSRNNFPYRYFLINTSRDIFYCL